VSINQVVDSRQPSSPVWLSVQKGKIALLKPSSSGGERSGVFTIFIVTVEDFVDFATEF